MSIKHKKSGLDNFGRERGFVSSNACQILTGLCQKKELQFPRVNNIQTSDWNESGQSTIKALVKAENSSAASTDV